MAKRGPKPGFRRKVPVIPSTERVGPNPLLDAKRSILGRIIWHKQTGEKGEIIGGGNIAFLVRVISGEHAGQRKIWKRWHSQVMNAAELL